MSGRWFRLYVSVVHDPKVQALPPPLFKFWINLLCIVEDRDGSIPPIGELQAALKARTNHLQAFLKALSERGLIDQTDKGLEVHNWRIRQYKSDISTDRVRAHRSGKGNVSETPPEQIQSRTERVSVLNKDIKNSYSCGNSLFSIRPGTPEWDAWERYYQEHKKPPRAFQLAMQRVLDGQQKTMTVPAKRPEQFDTSYAAAIELKRKLNENTP